MRPETATLREAIEFLRRHHAKPGAVEAAFAFDGDSGILLDFATGTEESVDLDESKLRACINVVVLHSHPVNAAATAYDWQHFVERDNYREFVVVGPVSNYALTKPAGWKPNFQWRKNPHEDWEDHGLHVLYNRGLSSNNPPTAAEWESVTVEINRRMARQYGLNFLWHREGETS